MSIACQFTVFVTLETSFPNLFIIKAVMEGTSFLEQFPKNSFGIEKYDGR